MQYRAGNGNWSFAYFGDIRGTGNALEITGLTVGPRYYVQIRTHNAGGDSAWTQASTHPTGTPFKPDSLPTLTPALGQLEVGWSAFTSTNQGASEVTDYDIRWSTARVVTVQTVDENRCNNSWRYAPDTGDDAADTSTSYTITGLNGDTLHCVQYRAANIHGNGPWSDSEFARTPPATAPGTIDDLTATASNRRITLRWTAPDANGSPIFRYTIECTSGIADGTHVCDRTDGTNTLLHQWHLLHNLRPPKRQPVLIQGQSHQQGHPRRRPLVRYGNSHPGHPAKPT